MIRWAILGCGKIARKFAADLKFVSNAGLVAVAARDVASAQQFGAEFSVPRCYGSYEDLVQDREIDVVYIATPHSHHYEHTLLCLSHDKAVLCEKAFAINHRQASEMISIARTKKLFLMEAFWTRFLPHYQIVREYIDGNKLGNIQYLYAEFGFKPTPPVSPRLYDLQLGGGSLLDIGVYPVFLTLDVLGKPDHITSYMKKTPSGADEHCSIQFRYNHGAVANMVSKIGRAHV